MSKSRHQDTEEEIEVIDAPPPAEKEEVVKVEEAEDPYVILQRNFDAVNKAKEEAEERARLAESKRDELHGQVTQHHASELETHKALIQKEYTLAENEGVSTENAYAAAMAAGDFAAAAKAQRAMVRIEAKLSQLESTYQGIEERIKNPPKAEAIAPPAVRDEFEEGLKNLPKPLQDWARQHGDDLRKRTPLALAAGDLALKKGLEPGSDAYLDFMDEQMGYLVEDEAEPKVVALPPVQKPATKRRMPPVAAPISRSSRSDTSKVYLSEFDKKTARDLGMSDKDFAVYVRDAPNSHIAQKFNMQLGSRKGG